MSSIHDPDQSSSGSAASPSTIAEMSAAYKVSSRTLRFYEQRGLLEPERQGAVRLYGEQDRVRLELILAFKKLGFSLKEIEEIVRAANASGRLGVAEAVGRLNHDRLRERIERLEQERAEVQAAIEELTAALAAKSG